MYNETYRGFFIKTDAAEIIDSGIPVDIRVTAISTEAELAMRSNGFAFASWRQSTSAGSREGLMARVREAIDSALAKLARQAS